MLDARACVGQPSSHHFMLAQPMSKNNKLLQVTTLVGNLRLIHSFTFIFDAEGEGEGSMMFQSNLRRVSSRV